MLRLLGCIVVGLALANPSQAETAMFEVGWERGGLAERAAGADGLYLTIPLAWAVPAARWLWLDGTYRYYRGGASKVEGQGAALTLSLYTDVFKPVFYLGLGPSAVWAGARDRSHRWLRGGHIKGGAAWPLAGAWGVGLGGKWQRLSRLGPANGGVAFDGWILRLALVYLPREDSRLLNW